MKPQIADHVNRQKDYEGPESELRRQGMASGSQGGHSQGQQNSKAQQDGQSDSYTLFEEDYRPASAGARGLFSLGTVHHGSVFRLS